MYLHIARKAATGLGRNRAYLNPAAFAPVCPATPTHQPPLNCAAYGTLRKRFEKLFPRDAELSVSMLRFRGFFPIYERLKRYFPAGRFQRVEPSKLQHSNWILNRDDRRYDWWLRRSLVFSTFGQIGATTNTARVFQGQCEAELLTSLDAVESPGCLPGLLLCAVEGQRLPKTSPIATDLGAYAAQLLPRLRS